ncbi:hypothetical protein CR513_50631, partial [Mucuna pruriens]
MATYRRLIGRLLYLINILTLPFLPNNLANLWHTNETHHHLTLRVLRYLKKSLRRGLFFSCQFDLHIYLVLMMLTRVDSKKQLLFCVPLPKQNIKFLPLCSFTKAKYQVLALVTRELQWISFLLKSLSQLPSQSLILYYDNQSIFHIDANPMYYEHKNTWIQIAKLFERMPS